VVICGELGQSALTASQQPGRRGGFKSEAQKSDHPARVREGVSFRGISLYCSRAPAPCTQTSLLSSLDVVGSVLIQIYDTASLACRGAHHTTPEPSPCAAVRLYLIRC
jgi:hypothetical protein